MAQLTVQQTSLDGLNPAYAAADVAGDALANNGSTVLHVKNGDASSHTVTIASQVANPPPGTVAQDQDVAVPAGEERIIGPFNRSAFNDSDGNVQVTYDDVTSVTVAAISVG